MPRDSLIETPPEDPVLAKLLARLADAPRSKRLEAARLENDRAIAALTEAQTTATAHYQRLSKADARGLDSAAKAAEAVLADAQEAHRKAAANLEDARKKHAPALERWASEGSCEIKAALIHALNQVDQIAAVLCTAGQSVERDGGTLPSIFRNAYGCRAMVRHVLQAVK
jgi:hypothetical protein